MPNSCNLPRPVQPSDLSNRHRPGHPALYNRYKILYLMFENQPNLRHKIPRFHVNFLAMSLAKSLWTHLGTLLGSTLDINLHAIPSANLRNSLGNTLRKTPGKPLTTTLATTLFILAASHLTTYPPTAHAQTFETAKYGNDFLSVGSGARALGMGGAHAAIASDATAAYWNPAGLAQLTSTDLAYMHSERFSGIVQYDYGAIAYPIRDTGSVIALSLFRQSVDDIANTLNAWDRERNLPRLRASDYIEFFSVSDLAILLSYASTLGNGIRWGVNTKIVNHRLGPFADGWGYSLDAGLQADLGDARLAIHLMDLTTMLKFWSVDAAAFGDFEAIYDEAIPSGQNERVLPVLKLGTGYLFRFDEMLLTTAADLDVRFENRQAYHLSLGSVSFEPHLGAELTYRGRLMIRAGATNITTNPDGSLFVSPTLGAGLQIRQLAIDYGFANFAGASAVLGQTHRISLRVQL